MKRKEHDIFEIVESGNFDFEQWLALNDLSLTDKALKKLRKAVNLAEKNISRICCKGNTEEYSRELC